MSRPNILIVMADQLAWKALPAYGDSFLATPHIDRIANRGVRFDRCYTSCPLCQPARPSLWTGRFPHETGVLSNGRNFPVEPVSAAIPTLGELFTAAGYRTAHFGKQHDMGGLRGFAHIEPQKEAEVEPEHPAWPVHYDTRRDRYTRLRTVEWLRETPADQPFILVADLQNPHDICSWIGVNQGEHADIAPPGGLPPLPANFETGDLAQRPLPVQYICCSHNRMSQAAVWNEENYRHYLAAYYHYCRRLDGEVGHILDALETRADAADTLVFFLSDHGDNMTSHRLVTKQVSFYEETTRVPFLAAGPGLAPGSRSALVSHLDLLPTLCDLAGIEPPAGLWGRSLRPLLENGKDEAHPYVVSEWHTEWGFTISPGRMVRSQRYKYTRYIEDGGEELYNLQADPGETRTLVRDPAHQEILAEHRAILDRHLQETADPFLSLTWKADSRWRSHPVGYPNHCGPAAPMVEG
ncbi:MAG: sulfatase-like hydrolase/transferase [Lentisphaeria bacterium]|jgi:choline-sulfatase|nr:sulfatase-like hydrolase/transferase [Lentisphaeria bacterium]